MNNPEERDQTIGAGSESGVDQATVTRGAKRPYHTPHLVKHGSMVELTGAGGSSITTNPCVLLIIILC